MVHQPQRGRVFLALGVRRREIGDGPDGALCEGEELQPGEAEVARHGLEGVDGVAAEEELAEVVVAEGGLAPRGGGGGVAQVVGAL